MVSLEDPVTGILISFTHQNMNDIKKSKYNKSYIYKIYSDLDDNIYIGSTLLSMKSLLSSYKSRSMYSSTKFFKYMNEKGVDHFFIELLERFYCGSREELEDRCNFWINKLKPQLNTNQPGFDDKPPFEVVIISKYSEHKKISDKGKLYTYDQRKYYDDFYEKHKGDKTECPCGGHYSYFQKFHHFKTKKHIKYINSLNPSNSDDKTDKTDKS